MKLVFITLKNQTWKVRKVTGIVVIIIKYTVHVSHFK